MPERRPGHEYQLAFDLSPKPESPLPDQIIRAGTLANFDSREPHLGRFIRLQDKNYFYRTLLERMRWPLPGR